MSGRQSKPYLLEDTKGQWHAEATFSSAAASDFLCGRRQQMIRKMRGEEEVFALPLNWCWACAEAYLALKRKQFKHWPRKQDMDFIPILKIRTCL